MGAFEIVIDGKTITVKTELERNILQYKLIDGLTYKKTSKLLKTNESKVFRTIKKYCPCDVSKRVLIRKSPKIPSEALYEECKYFVDRGYTIAEICGEMNISYRLCSKITRGLRLKMSKTRLSNEKVLDKWRDLKKNSAGSVLLEPTKS